MLPAKEINNFIIPFDFEGNIINNNTVIECFLL